jgi:hypothetical protein
LFIEEIINGKDIGFITEVSRQFFKLGSRQKNPERNGEKQNGRE